MGVRRFGSELTRLITSGPLSERLGGLRVGYLGRTARRWLGSRVHAVDVGPDWVPAEEAEHWIDVLVVDGDAIHPQGEDLRRIVADARSGGVHTIGFQSLNKGRQFSGLVDLTVAGAGHAAITADVQLAPLVDLARVSPIGGVREIDTAPLVAMSSRRRGTPRETMRSFERVLDIALPSSARTQWILNFGDLGSVPDIAPVLDHLRSAWGVVDHDALHVSPEARPQYLAQLAIAGIPFRLLDGPSTTLAASIGRELLEVSSGPVDDLFDPDGRERLSVAQRRIALSRFTDWERWEDLADLLHLRLRTRPTISVVLATNRPAQLDHAIRQVKLQNYEPIELILVLHGEQFGDDAAQRVMQRYPTARCVRAGQDVAFGSALNLGAEVATGELITKMDDDDWYGVDHLWDLVHAMEYSGATLVAKAAEWVYLSALDLTIRRFREGGESFSTTVAGGAMMLRRSDFVAVGGFRRARRHVDLGLINDVGRLGGDIYRTHGFGYLLNRNASGHTWDVGVDYFVDQSTTQIRGWSADEPLVRNGSPVPSESSEVLP